MERKYMYRCDTVVTRGVFERDSFTVHLLSVFLWPEPFRTGGAIQPLAPMVPRSRCWHNLRDPLFGSMPEISAGYDLMMLERSNQRSIRIGPRISSCSGQGPKRARKSPRGVGG